MPGYAGKLLRVNLSTGKIWTQPWAGDMREYLGGVGLGAKILYEEVGPKVHWDHPDNRLILATRRADRRRDLDPGQRLLRRRAQVLGL
ncbi:MAG: Aldehyde ferredoxin oxidoreductase [Candidatus Rokubacteria bacterium]|nr:Aldehyde ferredoxin oxidoreductase [Candidatus Rokubacteria bacterium]